MNFSTIKFVQDGPISRITLARPDKRNAISTEMIEELLRALDEVARRSSRVLILAAEGKAFCAGMDLEGLQKIARQSPGENQEDSQRMANLFRRLFALPCPSIAVVTGAAIAGGCGIATLADITLAVPEAKFGYTEVRIGFAPALVSVFLRRIIGAKHARELLLTGKIIDAAEAYRIGLISEVVPAEKIEARVKELTDSMLAASPMSVAQTKRLLQEIADKELMEELQLAVRTNTDIRSTDDFREGVASFLEKRDPKWTGK